MRFRTNLKIEIVLTLAVILAVVLYLNFFLMEEPFLLWSPDEQTQWQPDTEVTDFQTFAIVVTFLYDTLPTITQQFSISAIQVQLLMTGFSPILFAVISTIALLTGQMILYVVGMFIKRIHKGGFGDIAGKNHWLHKYHFMIYLMIPFVGILGDGAMLYSGHQRVNPLKIIPFLIIADFASVMRWLLPTMGELELGNHLGA